MDPFASKFYKTDGPVSAHLMLFDLLYIDLDPR